MGKVVGGMTLSIDGFASDANGDIGLLYPDLVDLPDTEMLQEEMRTTGAVILGRKSYELGEPDWYADHYEYQVPIFVVTHHIPEKKPKENEKLSFTFVSDGVESAVAQAKAAAADKNVIIIGANVSQQCINAGLCDELHMGVMPILLGDGLRYLDNIEHSKFRLEKIKLYEAGPRTDIWYRIIKL